MNRIWKVEYIVNGELFAFRIAAKTIKDVLDKLEEYKMIKRKYEIISIESDGSIYV